MIEFNTQSRDYTINYTELVIHYIGNKAISYVVNICCGIHSSLVNY